MESLGESDHDEDKLELAARLTHCRERIQACYACIPYDEQEALDGLIEAAVELDDMVDELNG